jgi:ElaB/YqjD/DUF883 family membrane-anchored ribosome-binding protein
MDRESPELIAQEMEQTRESLTEKVSLLEDKFVGQLQSASDTMQGTVDSVQETVHSVKSAVQDTVQNVSETVKQSVQSLAEGMKETLDVRKHVEAHPVAMVGGAAAAGFITGLLFFGRRQSATSAYAPAAAPGYAPIPRRPGWMDDLFAMAMSEVKKLAEQAMTTATTSLKKSVEAGIPKLIDTALPDIGGSEHHGRNGNAASGYRSPVIPRPS